MTRVRYVPRGRSAKPLFPRSTPPPPPYPEPTPEDRVVAQAAQARIRGLLGMPAGRAVPDDVVGVPAVGDEGGSPMVAYLALLDTLHRAAQLEDAKAAEGEAVMLAWARVAVPRWRAVSAQLAAAEAAQPAETWAWYLVWRQDRGLAAIPCDTSGAGVPLPSPQAAAGVEQFTP